MSEPLKPGDRVESIRGANGVVAPPKHPECEYLVSIIIDGENNATEWRADRWKLASAPTVPPQLEHAELLRMAHLAEGAAKERMEKAQKEYDRIDDALDAAQLVCDNADKLLQIATRYRELLEELSK